jgi:hypothetical protein
MGDNTGLPRRLNPKVRFCAGSTWIPRKAVGGSIVSHTTTWIGRGWVCSRSYSNGPSTRREISWRLERSGRSRSFAPRNRLACTENYGWSSSRASPRLELPSRKLASSARKRRASFLTQERWPLSLHPWSCQCEPIFAVVADPSTTSSQSLSANPKIPPQIPRMECRSRSRRSNRVVA